MLAFGLGSLATAVDERGDYQERYPSYANTPDEGASSAPQGGARVRAPAQKTPCQNPQGHNESDLCAQWRAASGAKKAAEWAFWQLIISVFGVIGLGFTLWFNKRGIDLALESGEDTERALKIAEDNAKAAADAAVAAQDANRPWIEVSPPTEIAMEFTASGVELTADVGLTNHGNSPATYAMVKAELIAVPVRESGVGDSKNTRQSKEKTLTRSGIESSLDQWATKHSERGEIVFPGKPVTAIICATAEIDSIRKAQGDPPEPLFYFLAVGVSYRFSGKIGRTLKAYLLIIKAHDFLGVPPYNVPEKTTYRVRGQHIELADTLEGYAT